MTVDDIKAWTLIHVCGRLRGQSWHTTIPAFCQTMRCGDWVLASDALRSMVDSGLALIYRWIPDGGYASRVPVSAASVDAVIFHGSFLIAPTPKARALFEKVCAQTASSADRKV